MKKEADVGSGAYGQEKLENNVLYRSPGAGEDCEGARASSHSRVRVLVRVREVGGHF